VTEHNLAELLEQSLPEERLHLLRLVADVAGGLGFPIYMVGGSVRDLLLGRTIRDFDLTVDGDSKSLAEYILRRLGGRVMIHSKFGTARWTPTESTFERLEVHAVAGNKLPPYLDFVSTRSETYEYPGALPKVKRSSMEDDLHRRDFTINAMAVRLDGMYFGQLVDIVDGRSDLERGLIRVLHPKSFIDDPTRMFRAIRYEKRYGFSIDTEALTLFNIKAISVLAELSGERLRNEFDLILEEKNRTQMLEKTKALGLLSIVHPALSAADYDRLTDLETMPAEGFGEIAVPDMLSFQQSLGWVMYLMNLRETDIEAIAGRLAFPGLLTKAVRSASSLFHEIPSVTNRKPSQWTFHLDELPSLAVYAVWQATFERPLREYLSNWQGKKPLTSGEDLKQLGLEPGPRYKEILSRLRAAWLDGEIETKEEEDDLRDHLIAG